MTERTPAPQRLRSDYGALVHEIRRRGLLRPRPGYYLALGGLNGGALLVVVAALVLLRDTWWALLLAPVFAVVSTQIAFFSHDAAHRQVTHSKQGIAALCLVHGNLLNGLSYGWWLDKHNAHHAHPNDLARDPDVGVGALVFDADQASGRTGAAGWLTRHQAGLFFPLLALEAFNLHAESVRAVLRPGMRQRWTEGLLLVGHLVLYVALLVSTLTALQAVLFALIHQGVFGVYLGSSFAPAHKGMPVLSPEESADPLLRQVLVSRNVRGGGFLRFALGGLNLQIEHHLFPSMPRPNLTRAQPIVARHCRARGISYTETSLPESWAMGLRHLRRVGTASGAGEDDVPQ